MKKKLLIIGDARWGKDTVAKIFRNKYGFSFKSSSVAAAEIFIFDTLKEECGYKTIEECFNDMKTSPELRAKWHNLIAEYNKDDPARLAKEILKDNDCYVGMRSGIEIDECKKQNIFDLIIWVDASKRLPPESRTSTNIDSSYADVIIDNNGSEDKLEPQIDEIYNKYLK